MFLLDASLLEYSYLCPTALIIKFLKELLLSFRSEDLLSTDVKASLATDDILSALDTYFAIIPGKNGILLSFEYLVRNYI